MGGTGRRLLERVTRRTLGRLKTLFARSGVTPVALPSDASSISDNERYRNFCRRAAEDRDTFAQFRRSPVYREILEHTSPEDGGKYLAVLMRDRPDTLAPLIQLGYGNDAVGDPELLAYMGLRPIAPSTLRYLKVLSDLEMLFGDLTGAHVVEIGVGYGGQCRLVSAWWELGSYTLIDLPEVLSLAARYLQESPLSERARQRLTYVDGTSSLGVLACDLLISNYAFTELRRETQEDYIRPVVRDANSGYMTCNFISQGFGIESMRREELEAIHSSSRWLAEEPRTHPDNEILVWGAKERISA